VLPNFCSIFVCMKLIILTLFFYFYLTSAQQYYCFTGNPNVYCTYPYSTCCNPYPTSGSGLCCIADTTCCGNEYGNGGCCYANQTCNTTTNTCQSNTVCNNGDWGSYCSTVCPSGCQVCSSGTCPNCINPTSGTCSFYLQCMDTLIPCGANGYAQNFGNVYCNAFLKPSNYNSFSQIGQAWVQNTLICLQYAAINIITNNYATVSQSCTELANLAFASHQACYVDNGFCFISQDWANVIGVVWKSIFSSYVLKIANQMISTGATCGAGFIEATYLTVQGDVNSIGSFLSQLPNTLSNLVNIPSNRFFVPSYTISAVFNTLSTQEFTVSLIIFPGATNSTPSPDVVTQLNLTLPNNPNLGTFKFTGLESCSNATDCIDEMFDSNNSFNIAGSSSSHHSMYHSTHNSTHNSSSKNCLPFKQLIILILISAFVSFFILT